MSRPDHPRRPPGGRPTSPGGLPVGAERSPSSPPIWRCASCGALVHPPEGGENTVGWCARCQRYVKAVRDGGPDPA